MPHDYNDSMVFNYTDVFFAHYFNDEVRCHKMIENHILMYVYSGELLVDENNKQTKIHGGQCVFIRRDNRVTLTKKAFGGEQRLAHLVQNLRSNARPIVAHRDFNATTNLAQ